MQTSYKNHVKIITNHAEASELDARRWGAWAGVQLDVAAATQVDRIFGFIQETRRRCTICESGAVVARCFSVEARSATSVDDGNKGRQTASLFTSKDTASPMPELAPVTSTILPGMRRPRNSAVTVLAPTIAPAASRPPISSWLLLRDRRAAIMSHDSW